MHHFTWDKKTSYILKFCWVFDHSHIKILVKQVTEMKNTKEEGEKINEFFYLHCNKYAVTIKYKNFGLKYTKNKTFKFIQIYCY